MGIEAALEYSRKHGLRALLVARGADPLVEIYENGASADTAQPLYSGTKSFWGVAALRAQDEGLIALDEPVAATFPAWSEDPWKRRVTPRMLLSLTGRLRLRRFGLERAALRTRARDGPEDRTGFDVCVRRNPASGLRRGLRTQTGAARS